MEDQGEDAVFIVPGTSCRAAVPRRAVTHEVSPMLHAIVSGSEEAPQARRDEEGRFVLEGPSEEAAFQAIMSIVRDGTNAHRELAGQLTTLEAKLQACRYADYYLLPGNAKMHLTKLLFKDFSLPREACRAPAPLDVAKLGLCRAQMILESMCFSGVSLKGLQLLNSHIKSVVIKDCNFADCDFGMCVTANDVTVSRSTLERVNLGIFTTKVTVEDSCQLVRCNVRVIEELSMSSSKIQDCTFRGSDEDQKDRQIVNATFRDVAMHGDVVLPFNKISCQRTNFHGEVRMSKSSVDISFANTRLLALPSIQSDTRVSLSLDSCEVVKALVFQHMRLRLSEVHLAEPCEWADVEFVDRITDITFPAGSSFRQVRFKHGLQACVASGCHFESCNFGHKQDAVSSCLLTKNTFQACRFPFLEADAPVANFSDSQFVACRIQWNEQFPHEESFLINSHWCRKWNLHGSVVTDGQ